jgi:hypothetical protein
MIAMPMPNRARQASVSFYTFRPTYARIRAASASLIALTPMAAVHSVLQIGHFTGNLMPVGRLPLIKLRQIVRQFIVVGLAADKNVFLDAETRRGVQRSGRDARCIAAERPPKQITPALLAKTSFGGLRGAIPFQSLGAGDDNLSRQAAGHCSEVAAGSTALPAVTGNDVSERSSDLVSNAAAKTAAAD